MRIVIPTKGRVGRQLALDCLPPKLREDVDLVCPSYEVKGHRRNYPSVNIVEQPDPTMTITKKRAWIMNEWENHSDKIVMVDDDVKFFVRVSDTDWHLRFALPDEVTYWFGQLEQKLSKSVPHAGFGFREGNHRRESGWKVADRQMFILGYYLPTVLTNAQFGRIENREDMDVTLQLLRKGFPNAVCHTFVTNQPVTLGANKGGCADERTIEAANADARRLAEFHPGYVRLVERKYKFSIQRFEVVCSWAKALKHGTEWRKGEFSRLQGTDVHEDNASGL